MEWLLSLVAMLATGGLPGSLQHERALAGLYVLMESHAMMVEVAGSDPAESGRRIVAVQHNGDGAVATDPSWTRPAQSYTVVIERDAVYAADGDNCSTRAQETWYVYCHEPMPDSQSCFALEIVDMACIPPGADDAP